MPPQRVYLSAGGQLPKLEGVVIAARYDVAAVRCDGHDSDPVRMALQRADLPAGSQLPYLDRCVLAAGYGEAAVRRDCHRVYSVRMSRQDANRLQPCLRLDGIAQD